MCSQYSLHIPIATLASLFNSAYEDHLKEFDESKPRILPYSKAPILLIEKGKNKLKLMRFSLLPSWAKESKVKFATYNARLETVDEKASFKKPFVNKHCIVPMTGFIEAVYTEKLAGNMIEFYPKEQKPLYAAGIWEEWKNPKSEERIFSFSILTTEPSEFISRHGHDRSPVLLDAQNAMQWLKTEGEAPTKLKSFLLESKLDADLDVKIDRPLKVGWEKKKA